MSGHLWQTGEEHQSSHLSTRQSATEEEIITAFSDQNKEFTLNH
jgi:hypothetical protein